MSDTNTISITFSKDFQPIIETAFNDFRQYLKDKIQNELTIEQLKLKTSKEKWDATLKTLNRNGALDKLILQAANKFMGEPEVSPKVNTNPTKIRSEEIKECIEKDLEKAPLQTLCLFLKHSLDSNPDLTHSIRIKSYRMKAETFELIECLLNSTDELSALKTLRLIKSKIDVEDISILIEINEMLNDLEKKIICAILNF